MVLQTWWCSSAICVYQVSPISNHLSLNVNLSTMCVPQKTSTWSRIVHFFLSLSTLKTKTSNGHSNYFTRFTNFDFMFKKYFVFVQSWCQLKELFWMWQLYAITSNNSCSKSETVFSKSRCHSAFGQIMLNWCLESCLNLYWICVSINFPVHAKVVPHPI